MSAWAVEPPTNVAAERDIITGMVVSDKVLKTLAPIIGPADLATPFVKTVVTWCTAYLAEHGAAPGSHLETIFEAHRQNGLDPVLAELISKFLTSLAGAFQGKGDFNEDFIIVTAKRYLADRGRLQLRERMDANPDRTMEFVEAYRAKVAGLHEINLGRGYTLNELLEADFPEARWLCEGLLTEGFNLLGGRMKFGKSHLLYNLALAVAARRLFLDFYPVEQGEVLFLDFETPDKRCHQKFKEITDAQGLPLGPWGKNLVVRPQGSWPRMDRGGLKMLEDYAEGHPNLRLVIIDTWKLFTPARKEKDQFSYNLEYADVSPVKQFAEKYGICVLASVHLNKSYASCDSPFDAFFGSTGLVAAADNLYAFVPSGGEADATLWGTGRYIDAFQIALEKNKTSKSWKYLGDAKEYEMTEDQREIVQLLGDNSEPMTRKDIAAALGKNSNSVAQVLFRMRKLGRIEKSGYGKYSLAGQGDTLLNNNTRNNNNCSNTRNTNNSHPVQRQPVCPSPTVTSVMSVTEGTTVTPPATPTEGSVKNGIDWLGDEVMQQMGKEIKSPYRELK